MILFMLISVIIVQLSIIIYLNWLNKRQSTTILDKLDSVEKKIQTKGKVTDPFKTATTRTSLGSSTKHIIVPKTPDQIRSENYQKIKDEGKKYGYY